MNNKNNKLKIPKSIILVEIVSPKPIILVDTSYTSFYRFFATLRWYSFAYPEEYKKLKTDNLYDWKTNKIFIEKYEKMYLDSIIKLVKKKVFNNSNIIFCMDSPKKQLWRTDIHCDYKGERVDLSLKTDFKPTFEYTYNTLIPNFIENNNGTSTSGNARISSLRVDKMEADDLIAIICMHMKKVNPMQQIYLISGDEDFLQLGRDNLIFINYKSKKPFILNEVQALSALRQKIILGDVSDCIPGIIKKGSKIKKKELLESDEKLNEYLNLNPEGKKQFEFNKKMIDFNNIPIKYYEQVVFLFDKLITK
jgi:5'-3' exonuclease